MFCCILLSSTHKHVWFLYAVDEASTSAGCAPIGTYAILDLGGVRQVVKEGHDYTCTKQFVQQVRALHCLFTGCNTAGNFVLAMQPQHMLADRTTSGGCRDFTDILASSCRPSAILQTVASGTQPMPAFASKLLQETITDSNATHYARNNVHVHMHVWSSQGCGASPACLVPTGFLTGCCHTVVNAVVATPVYCRRQPPAASSVLTRSWQCAQMAHSVAASLTCLMCLWRLSC